MKQSSTSACIAQAPNPDFSKFPEQQQVPTSDVVVSSEEEEQQQQQAASKLFDAGVKPQSRCRELAAKYCARRIEEVIEQSVVASKTRGGWIRRALEQEWDFEPPVPCKIAVQARQRPAAISMSKAQRDDLLRKRAEERERYRLDQIARYRHSKPDASAALQQ